MKHFLRQNGIWMLVIALLLSLVITLSSVLLGGSANPLSNAVQAVTAPISGMVVTRREYPVVYSGSLLGRILGSREGEERDNEED